jgi:hypothetical protein
MSDIPARPEDSAADRVSGKGRFIFAGKKQYVVVFVFFLAYLIIGVLSYKDYGISWDEQSHRQIGMVSAKYAAAILLPGFQTPELAALPPLAEYSAKHYGVIFDLPMYALDLLFGYSGAMPAAYYMRHLCTFLLFYLSVFFFYLIVKNRFQSWPLGLIAGLFLILSPRIFADSFYGKDSVFLSFFIICIYFFIRYLNRRNIRNALLFALATALLVDQRITGIFIPVLAVFLTGVDMIKAERPWQNLSKKLLPLIIYLVSFFLFMVLFWPYLWADPVGNLLAAFAIMKKYAVFSYDIFYWGEFIKSTEVPWHYIPAWMAITTPLLYIFFFLLGLAVIIRRAIRKGIILYSNDSEKQDILFLLLFFAPLAAVIILNSALYDGWRHMYFIYAPFLLIAMSGFSRLLDLMKEIRVGRGAGAGIFLAAVMIAGILTTSYSMIRHHPFQNVYFNLLAGNDPGVNFELDYWGLSFRQGLEYIVKNDKRPAIKLSANVIPPLINNAILLERSDLNRLQLTEIKHADYFLTNYRWHPQPYNLDNEVFTISVNKSKIMSVFRLR